MLTASDLAWIAALLAGFTGNGLLMLLLVAAALLTK